MTTGDAAAEDQSEFVGLTDGAIGIEEPLFEGIDSGATTEDEIVAGVPTKNSAGRQLAK